MTLEFHTRDLLDLCGYFDTMNEFPHGHLFVLLTQCSTELIHQYALFVERKSISTPEDLTQ